MNAIKNLFENVGLFFGALRATYEILAAEREEKRRKAQEG